MRRRSLLIAWRASAESGEVLADEDDTLVVLAGINMSHGSSQLIVRYCPGSP